MKSYAQMSLVPVLLSSPLPLYAQTGGSLNAPAAPTEPGSAMFTLEDIYNRLNDGTTGAKRTGSFVEPGAGPADNLGKTLDDVMGIAPEKDDTDGAATTDVLKDKTFWGLKSGEWGLQTGTATIPSCTPNPNATTRFTDSGGTVTDAYTCLMWLKDAKCVGKQKWTDVDTSAKVVTLINNADPECTNYTDDTYTDWRLPSLSELIELLTSGAEYLVKPLTPFSDVQTSYYWSFTSYSGNAWYVYLDNGNVYNGGKDSTFYVWPVRGGQ